VAVALIVVALARPQSVQPEEATVDGIDIYLVLDMSGSMRAIDLEPHEVRRLQATGKEPLNRFDSAVSTLKTFIGGRPHDRIGMVVFAKDAFLQFPLTLDRATILDMLDRLEIGDIEYTGTAIGNAIGRAVAGLKDSDADTKIVILITDGDRRGGNISPRQATEIAKELGIHVYPILVGREGTALVPAGRDILTGRTTYSRTEFPVNPELLKEIASETGGTYYRAADAEGLERDLHDILDQYERTSIEDATNVNRTELFVPFVVWAIVILVAQFLIEFTVLRKFP
jgi:Ca-activated chloride channel family protein